MGKREGTSASLYAQNVADVEHLLTSLASAGQEEEVDNSRLGGRIEQEDPEERPMTFMVEGAVDVDM